MCAAPKRYFDNELDDETPHNLFVQTLANICKYLSQRRAGCRQSPDRLATTRASLLHTIKIRTAAQWRRKPQSMDGLLKTLKMNRALVLHIWKKENWKGKCEYSHIQKIFLALEIISLLSFHLDCLLP